MLTQVSCPLPIYSTDKIKWRMQDAGFCFFIKLKMEPSRFPLSEYRRISWLAIKKQLTYDISKC